VLVKRARGVKKLFSDDFREVYIIHRVHLGGDESRLHGRGFPLLAHPGGDGKKNLIGQLPRIFQDHGIAGHEVAKLARAGRR